MKTYIYCQELSYHLYGLLSPPHLLISAPTHSTRIIHPCLASPGPPIHFHIRYMMHFCHSYFMKKYIPSRTDPSCTSFLLPHFTLTYNDIPINPPYILKHLLNTRRVPWKNKNILSDYTTLHCSAWAACYEVTSLLISSLVPSLQTALP